MCNLIDELLKTLGGVCRLGEQAELLADKFGGDIEGEPYDCWISNSDDGFDITVESGVVSSIAFYSTGDDGESSTQNLPFGLCWRLSSREVSEILGAKPRVVDSIEILGRVIPAKVCFLHGGYKIFGQFGPDDCMSEELIVELAD